MESSQSTTTEVAAAASASPTVAEPSPSPPLLVSTNPFVTKFEAAIKKVIAEGNDDEKELGLKTVKELESVQTPTWPQGMDKDTLEEWFVDFSNSVEKCWNRHECQPLYICMKQIIAIETLCEVLTEVPDDIKSADLKMRHALEDMIKTQKAVDADLKNDLEDRKKDAWLSNVSLTGQQVLWMVWKAFGHRRDMWYFQEYSGDP